MVLCDVAEGMAARRGEFERIRSVLSEADEPLTASEILELLEEHGEDFESAHRVATVLGRRADDDVEVIDGQPYRYRLGEGS